MHGIVWAILILVFIAAISVAVYALWRPNTIDSVTVSHSVAQKSIQVTPTPAPAQVEQSKRHLAPRVARLPQEIPRPPREVPQPAPRDEVPREAPRAIEIEPEARRDVVGGASLGFAAGEWLVGMPFEGDTGSLLVIGTHEQHLIAIPGTPLQQGGALCRGPFLVAPYYRSQLTVPEGRVYKYEQGSLVVLDTGDMLCSQDSLYYNEPYVYILSRSRGIVTYDMAGVELPRESVIRANVTQVSVDPDDLVLACIAGTACHVYRRASRGDEWVETQQIEDCTRVECGAGWLGVVLDSEWRLYRHVIDFVIQQRLRTDQLYWRDDMFYAVEGTEVSRYQLNAGTQLFERTRVHIASEPIVDICIIPNGLHGVGLLTTHHLETLATL